jgi:hypothetical protein
LLVPARRVAGIEVPEDDRHAILLLDVVGDVLVDATVRRAMEEVPLETSDDSNAINIACCAPKEFGLDTQDLYKGLFESLNLDVDLIIADRLEVGMTPGVRG